MRAVLARSGTYLRQRWTLLGMLRAAGPWPVAGTVVVALLTSLVPAATALALALLVGRVGHALNPAQHNGWTAPQGPLATLALVLLLGHVLDAVRDPLHYLVQSRVDGAFRAEVSRLAATSPTIEALEDPAVGRLVQLASADPIMWTERTPGAGAIATLIIGGRAITLASSSLVLAAFAWWLVPVILIPAAICTQLIRRGGVLWFRVWREHSVELPRRRVWSDANFDPGRAKELRIFGLGEFAVARHKQHTLTMMEPVWARARRTMAQSWRQVLLIVVPLAVAFTAVARSAATGRTSLAVATAALTAGAGVFRAIAGDPNDVIGAVSTVDAYQELAAALGQPTRPLERHQSAALSHTAAQRHVPAARHDPDHATVAFENVAFSYPGTTRRVADGLNLEIRPNELLAVVGLNGAGKSTLIKLLAGLYRPTAGQITYCGMDIRDVDDWRRNLSIVFQDFVRYPLTLAENVAMGNATIPVDPDALDAARRDSGLDVVLERLPDGWQTPLSRTRTGGVDLSGGQWQQVVLARALYAVHTGARLLVLDEPTAHLDVRTEFEVFERIAAHKDKASVVLISHRLSTVRQADRIVLLADGRITESGSHDELMAQGGRYAELFTIQAQRFHRGYDDRIEEGELL